MGYFAGAKRGGQAKMNVNKTIILMDKQADSAPQKKPPKMESLSLAPDFFKPESQHNSAKIKKVFD
jgi:hypothetical protein